MASKGYDSHEGTLEEILKTAGFAVLAWVPFFVWQLGYQKKTAEIAAAPIYVEPQDSLRRLTAHLADDLDTFLAKRGLGRSIGSGEDAKQYDQETINLYMVGYKSRTIEILNKLRGKGLDVGLLDAPGAAQSRFLLPDETHELRCLAFHLDEHGELVKF